MNNKNPLTVAGFLLGVGLGGFFDGILFHQILQVHNMVSNIYFPNTLVNVEINMFWDGMFHAFTWLVTLLGIFFLWKGLNNSGERKNGSYFIGLLLLGWGVFNIVEGIIDHSILQLHHVIQRVSSTEQMYSDIVFLISGLFLCLFGFLLCYRYKDNPSI
ncbi:DUF2243 domain-containing protein [Legionella drozanskii]|uniref:DUF2243 domain-containing protein n=1 Tax=Legionella drozanskii LLAP-1 TaxID=1212489 RepID=A0A0W0SWT1_9GAMM|nr:DUF2243 domain-containing protein [Legionella drozanskii]KTC87831.1 hypothetical protein Ldro_1450 [Legionella drozanskii LLAP-1]